MPASAARLDGLPPVARADARVLVLGSFPGVASLTAKQYYAHPRNQFWPVIGKLIGQPLANLPYTERLGMLTEAGVALWDVIASCLRRGSLDTSIRESLDNRFAPLLNASPGIRAVAFNGATAARVASWFETRGLVVYRMPSTSPAHAALDFATKLESWLALVRDGWLTQR
jgi:TDG/mug DNA glycosylase family protein